MTVRTMLLRAGVVFCFVVNSTSSATDNGYFLESSRWQTNQIPVCWENGSAATATEQGWVRARVEETWDAASSIRFTGWGACNASTNSGIRIVIQDAVPGSASLGRNISNVRNGLRLNFTFANFSPVCADNPTIRRNCIESNAIHEFGHALGLAHEHNRPDTDRSLCTDAPQGTDGDVIIGAWDATSIMNYCDNASYSNALSSTDRATINSMYPKDMVDFNGDGRTDVGLSGVSGWASIPVAFSNNDGSSSVINGVVGDFASWAATPGVKVLYGDFNNDGRTDVALTGGSGWASIPVAFSNGDGSFAIANVVNLSNFGAWAAASGAKAVTGDFNGDGRTDIALVGVPNVPSIPVALSNGDGSFSITTMYMSDFPGWAGDANAKPISGDFNGDGLTDLALVGGSGWASIPVAFSTGGGFFNITNISVYNIPRLAGLAGAKIVSGDFNADGRTDIAVAGGQGMLGVAVAFSNGDGSFRVTEKQAGGFNTWLKSANAQLIAADFNGDARTDLAITGPSQWGSIPVLFSIGDGTWTSTNQLVSDFPALWTATGAQVIVGDFNRDRSADLGLAGGSGWTTIPKALSLKTGAFSVTTPDVGAFGSWASTPGVKIIKQNP